MYRIIILLALLFSVGCVQKKDNQLTMFEETKLLYFGANW